MNNLSNVSKPVKRKHYELELEKDKKYIPINKKLKRSIDFYYDPFILSKIKEFSILSPLTVFRNFPYNFMLNKYFEESELDFIMSSIQCHSPENVNLINLDNRFG
jgi:hypothetical protein